MGSSHRGKICAELSEVFWGSFFYSPFILASADSSVLSRGKAILVFYIRIDHMAFAKKAPQGPAESGFHKIRITLHSRNIANLEKGPHSAQKF